MLGGRERGQRMPGGGDTAMTVPGTVPPDIPAADEESYRILRSRIDLSRLPRLSRDVTERVIHASADFDYLTDLVCDEESLAAGVAALAAGAPVIADSAMVAAGITGCPVICKTGEPLTIRLARTAAISRSAAAVRLAFGDAGPGAVWVAGGTPEALQEILARRVEAAFIIGLPAGFAGAAEVKDALRASGLRSVSNVSEKGGPAVAVAALDALLAVALTVTGSRAGWPPGAPRPRAGD
jgi:precorrin-8X/cobalt-precorrin-8 methylmutase